MSKLSDLDRLFAQINGEQNTNVVQKDLAGFGPAAVAPSETLRRISKSFSPAGVTSPFVARTTPTDNASVVSVSGR
jgi:hypothetical protein